jgi:phospholipid/cholesterol/gamma-HCH transport system substrate-binding protein
MKRNTVSNVQLGFFVIVGTAFLVTALYYIGSNRSLFNKTFEVSAIFHNVNGLMKGNNVRFSGIDVGTIKQVEIVSDTSVRVIMIIEDRVQPFIKKNSIASVGTDGLMGNKLVNITNPANASPEIIQEGDMLAASKPVETDEMLRTLDKTNDNLYQISTNLNKITEKVNNSHSLWSVLMDTTLSEDIKQSVHNIRVTTKNAASFSMNLNSLLRDLENGNSVAGVLLYDTISSANLKTSLEQLKVASQQAAQVTKDISLLTEKIKNGAGGAGVLLSDTAFAYDVKKSMDNIQQGTDRFNKNMEALKHNFLFRNYFKRQEKEQQKGVKADIP